MLVFALLSGTMLIELWQVRKWCNSYVNHTLSGYMENMVADLDTIKTGMLEVLLDERFEQILQGEDELARFNYLSEVGDDFGKMRMQLGNDYNFFIFIESKKDFIEVQIPQKLKVEQYYSVRNALREAALEKKLYEKAPQCWAVQNIEGKQYIIGCYRKADNIIGVYFPVSVLLNLPKELGLTGDDRLFLLDEKNNFFYTGEAAVSLDEWRDREMFGYYVIMDAKIPSSALSIRMRVSSFGILREMTFVQILLLALTAAILCISQGMLMYVRKRLLYPIESFVRYISGTGADTDKAEQDKNSFLELEEAAKLYDGLQQQIENLKIRLYEEQLGRQKTEMDYLQLQIKPHFFINCLNMIYGMIETKNYAEIQEMTIYVSGYLRYKFRDGMKMVPIEEELRNIDNYLNIQYLWYGDIIKYSLDNRLGDKKVCILPLMIQTLIENSIKYALNPDGELQIFLLLEFENSMLHIKIGRASCRERVCTDV